MFFKVFSLVLVCLLSEISTLVAVSPVKHDNSDIYRLPDDVRPKSYKLKMKPNLSTFTFSGEVAIKVLVLYSTYVFKLHSKNLKITSYKLINSMNDVHDMELDYNRDQDLLLVKSKQKLLPERVYLLELEYEGTLNDEPVGFYKSWYKTIESEKKKWLAITHFEPNYAREAFPCFDEPRFRTPFEIHLARNTDQISIGNSNKKIQSKSDSTVADLKWDIFEETSDLPTYLIAFMVGELKPFSLFTDVGQIRINFKNGGITDIGYLSDQSVKLIREFYQYTDIKFSVFEFAIVPDMRLGAMSNFEMITIREIYSVLDKQMCAEIQKTMVTLAVSHLITCQWFGGIVIPNWWDHNWIVRGLAVYFEYKLSAEIEPKWELNELFVFEELQSSLWTEIEYQRAMTSPITKRSEMRNLYNVVTWDKASCIFRMLEHIITNVGFRCGLKSYLNNGKIKYNGISEPRTLFEAFETQTCFTPSLPPMITLTEMLETWTNNIGFPLITVKRNTATNIISFHQSTYKSPRAPEILPDQTWIVPITYITRSDMDYKTSQPLWSIGNKPVKSLKAISPSDWVLCNYLQAGYYRVMYEPQNWELLIKQLLENHDKIPVINRAQLLDDAFALAYDDKLNYIIPFKLAKYLEKETEILPWLSATFHLDLLYSELKQTKDMRIIKNYIKNLITKLYSVHGFNIKSDATHLFKVGYPVILSLACKIGMEKCVKDAIGEFIAHNADLNNVQADLKGVVFCTACEHAPRPKDVWNTLWELYRNTESSYLKTLILSKLACTNNEELLETILSKLFNQNDEDIRNSDKSFIISTFFKSPSSVTAFINFLQKKLPVTKFDERSFSILHSMTQNLGSKIENEEQLKQLKYLGYKMEQMKESEYENLKIFIRNSLDKGTKNLEKNNIRMRLIAFALQ